MKLLPILTLAISVILGIYGVLDMTTSTGMLCAIAGLLGVAISGGALAICSSVESLQKNDGSSEVAKQAEWEAEQARRAAIERSE